MKHRTIGIIFGLIALFSFSTPANAQTIGFSIDPPIFETVIKPGKTVTQIFTIQNLSESDKTVVARVVPFTPEGDTGIPLLRPNLQPDWLSYFSLVNTYTQLNKPFDLGAGQTVQLILSISIPANAELTDHYATLIITTNLLPLISTTNAPASLINTTIGANILLSVNNKVAPSTLVRIDDFIPDEKDYLFRYGDFYLADNLLPIHFTATAENLGKYLTKTSGIVQVLRGNEVVSLQSLVPLNLLALSKRQLEGSPSGEIVFQPTFTDLGVHRVAIDIRSENSSSHAEISLFLFPLKLLLGSILGLILLIIILRITSKRKLTLDTIELP